MRPKRAMIGIPCASLLDNQIYSRFISTINSDTFALRTWISRMRRLLMLLPCWDRRLKRPSILKQGNGAINDAQSRKTSMTATSLWNAK